MTFTGRNVKGKNRKYKWPTKEELEEKIKHCSYEKIAKFYGASESCVRRWARKYNLRKISFYKGIHPVLGVKIVCPGFRHKSRPESRRVVRPSSEDLIKMILSMSWCAIARKYGVTDNAVRKWAKWYGINIERLNAGVAEQQTRSA